MAAAAGFDDDDPFCSVCKQTDDADHMLLCSTCNTGNHTHCLGLPDVPADYHYCSEGCKQLALLQPGCIVVIEAPQPLYADEKQPHLSQALFCNSVISISGITLADCGAFRDIKALCPKAPVRDSVRMYSVAAPHQQLKASSLGGHEGSGASVPAARYRGVHVPPCQQQVQGLRHASSCSGQQHRGMGGWSVCGTAGNGGLACHSIYCSEEEPQQHQQQQQRRPSWQQQATARAIQHQCKPAG